MNKKTNENHLGTAVAGTLAGAAVAAGVAYALSNKKSRKVITAKMEGMRKKGEGVIAQLAEYGKELDMEDIEKTVPNVMAKKTSKVVKGTKKS